MFPKVFAGHLSQALLSLLCRDCILGLSSLGVSLSAVFFSGAQEVVVGPQADTCVFTHVRRLPAVARGMFRLPTAPWV